LKTFNDDPHSGDLRPVFIDFNKKNDDNEDEDNEEEDDEETEMLLLEELAF
jgi:hypothetical protein